LRNLLGLQRVRDITLAESQALQLAQDQAIERYTVDHRFTAEDICDLHSSWLGAVYPWAGQYRAVNIGKGGFQFASAALIPDLMRDLARGPLAQFTPCLAQPDAQVAHALAVVHAELVLIHPFREGNGRLARLLAMLMALQRVYRHWISRRCRGGASPATSEGFMPRQATTIGRSRRSSNGLSD
jgi:cell filamentation protein